MSSLSMKHSRRDQHNQDDGSSGGVEDDQQQGDVTMYLAAVKQEQDDGSGDVIATTTTNNNNNNKHGRDRDEEEKEQDQNFAEKKKPRVMAKVKAEHEDPDVELNCNSSSNSNRNGGGTESTDYEVFRIFLDSDGEEFVVEDELVPVQDNNEATSTTHCQRKFFGGKTPRSLTTAVGTESPTERGVINDDTKNYPVVKVERDANSSSNRESAEEVQSEESKKGRRLEDAWKEYRKLRNEYHEFVEAHPRGESFDGQSEAWKKACMRVETTEEAMEEAQKEYLEAARLHILPRAHQGCRPNGHDHRQRGADSDINTRGLATMPVARPMDAARSGTDSTDSNSNRGSDGQSNEAAGEGPSSGAAQDRVLNPHHNQALEKMWKNKGKSIQFLQRHKLAPKVAIGKEKFQICLSWHMAGYCSSECEMHKTHFFEQVPKVQRKINSFLSPSGWKK